MNTGPDDLEMFSRDLEISVLPRYSIPFLYLIYIDTVDIAQSIKP
jgi:hypothetical protein